MPRLTFIGPFRELKNYGFKHLYGRNCRCWSSYEIGNGRDTNIWMKKRRLEVGDMYRHTILLMPHVQGNDEGEHICGPLYSYNLDMIDGVLEVYDYDKHPLWKKAKDAGFPMDVWSSDKENPELRRLIYEHQHRHREVHINEETMKELRVLDGLGWIGEAA